MDIQGRAGTGRERKKRKNYISGIAITVELFFSGEADVIRDSYVTVLCCTALGQISAKNFKHNLILTTKDLHQSFDFFERTLQIMPDLWRIAV